MEFFSHFGRKGQILIPIVIVIAAIVGILGVTIAGVAYTQSLATGQRASARVAEQAARAGIDDILLKLARNADYTTSGEAANGGCIAGEYRLVINNVETCVKVEQGAGSGGGAFGGDGAIQSDPTGSSDIAYAVAVDTNAVYVAGYQSTGAGCLTGSACWRIEKYDLTTGAPVSAFGVNGVVQHDLVAGFEAITAMAVDSSALYLAGYQGGGSGCVTGNQCWRIEKRDKNTGERINAFDTDGIVQRDPTSGNEQALAIAISSSALYVAGYEAGGATCSSNCWRIEKLDLTTGAPVSAFGGDGVVHIDASGGIDIVNAIATDSSGVYVAGQQAMGGNCSTGNQCWRIEKLNLTTGASLWSVENDPTNLSDIPRAIALDASAVYVAGQQGSGLECTAGAECWRIEKRNLTTGALVLAFDGDGIIQRDFTFTNDQAYAIAVDATAVYVAGHQAVNTDPDCSTGVNCWRIEKYDVTTGTLVSAFGGDGAVQSDPLSGSDVAYAITFDANALYIAGCESGASSCSSGNSGWRIEKRDKTTGALADGSGGGGGSSNQRIITSRATVKGVMRTICMTVDVSSSGEVRVMSRSMDDACAVSPPSPPPPPPSSNCLDYPGNYCVTPPDLCSPMDSQNFGLSCPTHGDRCCEPWDMFGS